MSSTPRLHSARATSADALPGRFRTLQYQPTPSEPWYHVLFGHVPRFQMDFILRPELPWRKFRPQHLAHLGPQIKFLSPGSGLHYAVAVGNLSSNDTQHVAGRGGLALLVSIRVMDLRDHAQRESPVFAHALVAIDEPLDPERFAGTAETFVDRVLGGGLQFYHGYYASGQADNFDRVYGYVRSFRDLPTPGSAEAAALPCHTSDDPPPYNQILVDCRGVASGQVLRLMARLGVLLYRTSSKWTTITTGSEEFEPKIYNGEDYSIAVRLHCGSTSFDDLERQARSAAPGSRVLGCRFLQLPDSDAELGAQLFGLPGGRRAASAMATALPSFQTPAQPGEGRPEPGRHDEAARRADLTAQYDEFRSACPEGVYPQAAPLVRHEPARKQPGLGVALFCALLGLLAGAGGMWLLVRLHGAQPGSNRAPHTKAARLLPSSGAGVARPEPLPVAMTQVPAGEAGSETLSLRRAFVTELRQQAEPVSLYARAMLGHAKSMADSKQDSLHWRRLRDESARLQTQIEKMDHIAAALVEPNSVHRIDTLIDNYCKVLSVHESVVKLERKDKSVDEPSRTPGKNPQR